MRPLLMSLLAACLLTTANARAAESKLDTKPIRATKIILIGDSTVAVQGGWGSSFCSEHVTSFAACLNLARGGRSSGSYITEGSWDIALNEARTPGYDATWLLIQFGHNDQPGKPGRSTDLQTEFPAFLKRYVTEARQVGARPVLLTPLTRRQFKGGKLQSSFGPWVEAIQRVAKETNTPLVDLNALSAAAVQAMGPGAANEFAPRPAPATVVAAAATGNTIELSKETNDMPPAKPSDPSVPPMAQPKLTFDYTHLGRKGSDFFAAMVTQELAKQVPEMRPLLIP